MAAMIHTAASVMSVPVDVSVTPRLIADAHLHDRKPCPLLQMYNCVFKFQVLHCLQVKDDSTGREVVGGAAHSNQSEESGEKNIAKIQLSLLE